MKRFLAILLALTMVVGLGVSVWAADEEVPKDGKITVTPPANTLDDSENTYTLYKVFGATTDGSAYSYKLSGDHDDVPTGFILDDAGNVYFADIVDAEGEGTFKTSVGGEIKILKNKSALSNTDIDAIAAYVTDGDKVETKTVKGVNPAVFENLEYGYYYVTTTTGALVIIDSTKPDVEVTDKNTVPVLDKKAKQAVDPTYMEIDDAGHTAIAQVGTVVPFEATITVGKGAKGYVFHDTMTAGLSYNGDVAVTATAPEGGSAPTGEWYTIKDGVGENDAPENGDTITIPFVDDIVEGTVITITYSATITSNALSVDPAKNTASLDYGDSNGHNSVPDVPVEIYNAKITVNKVDGKDEALAGAGFVLKNEDGKYYKYVDAVEDDPETETDEAVVAHIEWVDNVADATEYVTAVVEGVAQVEFKGLGVGKYTLVENTVPAGYNPAADSEFEVKTVEEEFIGELELSTKVVNNQGTELPSTGGIGTTIFYIVGGLLAVGAGVVLVTKKRMSKEEL